MRKIYSAIVYLIMCFAFSGAVYAQKNVCKFNGNRIVKNDSLINLKYMSVDCSREVENDDSVVYSNTIEDASGFKYKLVLKENLVTDEPQLGISTFYKVVISPIYDTNYTGLRVANPFVLWSEAGWLGLYTDPKYGCVVDGFGSQNKYYIKLNLKEATALIFVGPNYFPEGSNISIVILRKGDCELVYNKISSVDKCYESSGYYDLKVALSDYYSDEDDYTPTFGTLRLSRTDDEIQLIEPKVKSVGPVSRTSLK